MPKFHNSYMSKKTFIVYIYHALTLSSSSIINIIFFNVDVPCACSSILEHVAFIHCDLCGSTCHSTHPYISYREITPIEHLSFSYVKSTFNNYIPKGIYLYYSVLAISTFIKLKVEHVTISLTRN